MNNEKRSENEETEFEMIEEEETPVQKKEEMPEIEPEIVEQVMDVSEIIEEFESKNGYFLGLNIVKDGEDIFVDMILDMATITLPIDDFLEYMYKIGLVIDRIEFYKKESS